MFRISFFLLVFVSVFNMNSRATAQAISTSEDQFLPENAILDTSILFAIGAREARQELRGSYGWPTFQEGIVDQIYFRFDPDGYARFSPSARLDSDVFEVICRPRTLDCMGRKSNMSFGLNSRGQLQLTLDGVAAGDQFYISDGATELELPSQILEPLDAQFENVLSVGGELVVRRGQQQMMVFSLSGFPQVASYIRWIQAEQDYLALPRNWPIPGSPSNPSSSLTQVESWRNDNQNNVASLTQPITSGTTNQSQIAELTELIEVLVEKDPTGSVPTTRVFPQRAPIQDATLDVQLQQLELRIDALEKSVFGPEEAVSPEPPMLAGLEQDAADDRTLEVLARQLDEIMDEFNVDPGTAAALLRLRQGEVPAETLDSLQVILSASDPTGLTEAILAEQAKQDPAESEFLPLTDYFRSVLDD